MILIESKINQVLTKYNQLKSIDVHINNYDDNINKRQKDMIFGKLLGYEECLKQLGILE